MSFFRPALNLIIALLYEAIILLFFLVAFPVMLLQMALKGKYKISFLPKLGCGFPSIDKRGRPLIWIHAVSVGETQAVAALAKRLKNSPEQPLILVSSITETGHQEAKRAIPFADYHVFLPFDFFLLMKFIIRKTKPDLVILCETDWWYNFLSTAKRKGAQIVVVNAKISERSTRRFQKLSFFSNRLFQLVDLFCVQSKHYIDRFITCGIDAKKLVVTGNLKLDGEHPRASDETMKALQETLGISTGDIVITLGSTHEPEEKLLLTALLGVWEFYPSLKVLIVPRHPERFDEVASIVKGMGLPLHRHSLGVPSESNARVVLVDAMGLLRLCYQLSTVAVVAGSFTTKVGGHNILEPLYFDTPLVFGPHMQGQPELLELVLNYKAGAQVSVDGLSEKLVELIKERRSREALIVNGMRLLVESRGAVNRSYNEVEALLEGKKKKTL